MSGSLPKHGLYARAATALEIRHRKVRRLMRKLRVAAPWLQPSDEPVARAYCEIELLSASVFAALTAVGPIDQKGDPRRLVDEHRKLRLAAIAYARELGLTPLARMAINAGARNGALDIVAQMGTDEGSPEDGVEAEAEGTADAMAVAEGPAAPREGPGFWKADDGTVTAAPAMETAPDGQPRVKDDG